MKTSFSFFWLTLISLFNWPVAAVFGQTASFPKAEIIAAEQGLPQGFVPGIVQDSQGLMWIATRNGLCKYDGQRVKVFENKNTSSLSSLGLEEMTVGPDRKIWILSDQGDVDIFDPISETIFNYSRQAFFKRAFQKRDIKSIFPDKQNRLWLSLEKAGLALVDLKTNKVRFYDDRKNDPDSLNTVKVLQITQLRDGSIWLATKNGIFTVDTKSGHLTRYRSSHPDFARIRNSCYAMTERPNGNLLFLAKKGVAILNRISGNISYQTLPLDENFEYNHPIVSDSKGTSYFFRMNRLYRFSDSEGLNEIPQAGFVSEFKSIYIDRSDVLWTGTNGQGVRKYNLRATYFSTAFYKKSFTHDVLRNVTNAPENTFSALPSDLFVYNFRYTFDNQQNMWFSAGRTPVYKFNLITRHIEAVQFPVSVPTNQSSERAISLSTDPAGRVWALHDSILLYREGDRWLHFKYPIRPAIESGIMQLVADKQALWIATNAKGLYRVDRSTGKITRFAHRKGDEKTINSDNIYCLFADPQEPDLLWIGTFGGGLARFDKRTGFVKNITTKDGLPNDVVYSAIPDLHGNIWAATNQGLAKINKKTFQVRVYTREDGLLADEFNRFHTLQVPDGRIFLGGIEGITGFNPALSNLDQYQPPVLVTAISVNNVALEPGKQTRQLPIKAVRSLELDHRKNFITVEFAAMQFNRSDKIRYRYQLQNLEDKWIETENPVTKYTDLRPGQYILKLNASNTEGVWSTHIATLNILIHPPWWQTWWAYLIYLMAALGLASVILRFYTKRLKMRQSMILKQKELELIDKEAKQLRDLDEMKTRFFSNITHEFRTPLTLILAPTEQMMGETRNSEDVNRLGLIDRNAHQLLGLVNQLLDLSKLESGTMKITESKSDLRAFVERLTESFHAPALAKDIVLKREYIDLENTYWFDHEKLERILNNLLSNALKFTPEGGMILTTLRGLEKGVKFSVYDNGTGIDREQLDKIFERFYQVDYEDSYQVGSGIGLAIVKELVEVQNGTIRVVSEGHGTGTEFIIRLPYRVALLNEDISITAPIAQIDDQEKQVFDQTVSTEKILLVEDHPELGEFIEKSLGKKYQCLRAGNGAEALSLMAEQLPDLVISDVMMPVMDGYALCKKIKEDFQTSHIPVILLTAKNAQTSRMEGLSAGADDYITKPFHMSELELRVQNILTRQRRLRETLHAQLTTQTKLQENIEDDVSDPFFTQLYSILNAQLDNPSFGVTELTQEIGMSNSSLNRKLKALSGISAVELIRNYRLKKAADYLDEGKNVSEAAYLVGFDNLSYFAKCFRDLFQMSPRDYAAKG